MSGCLLLGVRASTPLAPSMLSVELGARKVSRRVSCGSDPSLPRLSLSMRLRGARSACTCVASARLRAASARASAFTSLCLACIARFLTPFADTRSAEPASLPAAAPEEASDPPVPISTSSCAAPGGSGGWPVVRACCPRSPCPRGFHPISSVPERGRSQYQPGFGHTPRLLVHPGQAIPSVPPSAVPSAQDITPSLRPFPPRARFSWGTPRGFPGRPWAAGGRARRERGRASGPAGPRGPGP